MALPGFVVPGQLLVSLNDSFYPKYENGYGTSIDERGIYASLLGKVKSTELEDKKWLITVVNEVINPYAEIPTAQSGNSKRNTSIIPQVGDIVYGKVLRLGQKQVNLDIIAVENKGNITSEADTGVYASSLGSIHPSVGVSDKTNELGVGYGAVIRSQDIRATERDKVKPENFFTPGDLVRASVLSLGDGNKYYLSTVHNDLGVVFSKDPASGEQLVPLDWQMMANPSNGTTFLRKCANPFVT